MVFLVENSLNLPNCHHFCNVYPKIHFLLISCIHFSIGCNITHSLNFSKLHPLVLEIKKKKKTKNQRLCVDLNLTVIPMPQSLQINLNIFS
jgi:hypothetical protein